MASEGEKMEEDKKRGQATFLAEEMVRKPILRRRVGIWFIRFQTRALLPGFSIGPPKTLVLTIKML